MGGRKASDWKKGWGCGERREACRGSSVGGSEVGGAKEGAKGRELGALEPTKGVRPRLLIL